MTELLQSSVSSIARGVIHEFEIAGAVKFACMVKPAGVVVGHVDAGEQRQYRGLVLAVPLPPGTAGRQFR
jgi:hypothetical protein